LKLKCDEPLSNVAFNVNVRRYSVAVASVLIGGFLVGAIVTATHQTEEIIFEPDGEFVARPGITQLSLAPQSACL
jgi:hypothetical protein